MEERQKTKLDQELEAWEHPDHFFDILLITIVYAILLFLTASKEYAEYEKMIIKEVLLKAFGQ